MIDSRCHFDRRAAKASPPAETRSEAEIPEGKSGPERKKIIVRSQIPYDKLRTGLRRGLPLQLRSVQALSGVQGLLTNPLIR